MRALALIVLLSVLAIPAEANAVTSAPPDENTITSYRYVQTLSNEAAGSNCRTNGYQVEANSIGGTVWKFGSSLRICWKGGDVISKSWGACWGWVAQWSLWHFNGCEIEDQSLQSLPRAYIWRQWRGHFTYCVTWICKQANPWVYVGGRGNGTFGVNGGSG